MLDIFIRILRPSMKKKNFIKEYNSLVSKTLYEDIEYNETYTENYCRDFIDRDNIIQIL